MKTTKRLATLLIALSTCAVLMAQSDKHIRYDKESDLEGIEMEPQLLSMHENYDPMDHGTWPAYFIPCVAAVDPQSDDVVERTALWCTKKATYMFTITEHWENRIFTSTSTQFIRDSKTGKNITSRIVWVLHSMCLTRSKETRANSSIWWASIRRCQKGALISTSDKTLIQSLYPTPLAG